MRWWPWLAYCPWPSRTWGPGWARRSMRRMHCWHIEESPRMGGSKWSDLWGVPEGHGRGDRHWGRDWLSNEVWKEILQHRLLLRAWKQLPKQKCWLSNVLRALERAECTPQWRFGERRHRGRGTVWRLEGQPNGLLHWWGERHLEVARWPRSGCRTPCIRAQDFFKKERKTFLDRKPLVCRTCSPARWVKHHGVPQLEGKWCRESQTRKQDGHEVHHQVSGALWSKQGVLFGTSIWILHVVHQGGRRVGQAAKCLHGSLQQLLPRRKKKEMDCCSHQQQENLWGAAPPSLPSLRRRKLWSLLWTGR